MFQRLLSFRSQAPAPDTTDIQLIDRDSQFRASYNNGEPSIGPIIFIQSTNKSRQKYDIPNVGPSACLTQIEINHFTEFINKTIKSDKIRMFESEQTKSRREEALYTAIQQLNSRELTRQTPQLFAELHKKWIIIRPLQSLIDAETVEIIAGDYDISNDEPILPEQYPQSLTNRVSEVN